MSRDHDDAAWQDPGGPTPDDPMWLTPATGWEWDADALMTAEYVGYPLYLRLRDRLQTLRVPTQTHNQVITELIDLHDMSALDHGVACSTLLVCTTDVADAYEFHQVSMHDVVSFAPLSGKDAPPPSGWFEK